MTVHSSLVFNNINSIAALDTASFDHLIIQWKGRFVTQKSSLLLCELVDILIQEENRTYRMQFENSLKNISERLISIPGCTLLQEKIGEVLAQLKQIPTIVTAFANLGYNATCNVHDNYSCYEGIGLTFAEPLAEVIDDNQLRLILSKLDTEQLNLVTYFDFASCPMLTNQAMQYLRMYCPKLTIQGEKP